MIFACIVLEFKLDALRKLLPIPTWNFATIPIWNFVHSQILEFDLPVESKSEMILSSSKILEIWQCFRSFKRSHRSSIYLGNRKTFFLFLTTFFAVCCVWGQFLSLSKRVNIFFCWKNCKIICCG